MNKRSRKGYYVKGEFVTSGSQADRAFRETLDESSAPSRSAKKRASKSLQVLGAQLIAAPNALLEALPLPEELRDAIGEARNITSFGARRRQTQFVGKLMRRLDDVEVEAIRAALAAEGRR
jgi:ribosome-associated protein